MITFLATMMAHAFGKRSLPEMIWMLAAMVGVFELMMTGLLIGQIFHE